MNYNIGGAFMVLFLIWWGGINSELNLNQRLQYTSVSVFLQKSTTSVFLQKSTTSVFLQKSTTSVFLQKSTTSVFLQKSTTSVFLQKSTRNSVFSVFLQKINDNQCFFRNQRLQCFFRNQRLLFLQKSTLTVCVDISLKINVNLCQQKISESSNLLFLVLTVCDPFNLQKKKKTSIIPNKKKKQH